MADSLDKNLERRVQEDYQIKLALREKESKYYPDKMQEFGLKPIDRFLKYCPDPSKYMQLGITFAHKDLEIIAEAIADNKPWAVVSGLNPSGPLHLGHKAIFDELLWMQKHGAEVFIPITNDESYTVGKTKSLAEAKRIAYEEVIPSIIAMGFDPKKTHIFVDSDYPDIYNVAMDLSNKITLNKAFKVFGFDQKEEGENPGTMFYRSAVQVAQILLPQYEEFGGPKPTIIPVGIDQHPYILLARDIAEKKGFIPPAEIVTKFLQSLKEPGKKMSASIPESCIFLTDPINVAREKIKNAFTGGSFSAEFQKKHGGVPEICSIFLLLKYHFLNFNQIKKLKKDYENGKIMNSDLKKLTIKYVEKYLKKHQSKLKKAKERTEEFLLRTPIKSIFKY
jgi:tryptophanyl-tRNA synthetase